MRWYSIPFSSMQNWVRSSWACRTSRWQLPYISTSLVTLLFAFMVGLIKLPMAEPSLSDAIHGQSKFHRDIYRVLRVPERILSPIMRWTQNSHYAPANPHEIKIDSKKRGSWARHTDSPM